MSGRKKKIRPDLDGITTLALLEKVTAEALRLRDENKRLTAELKAALKRSKPVVKKVRKAVAVAVAVEGEDAPPVVEKKTGPRRQALGRGLARLLGARLPS